jgi:hypothetical protein
MRVMMVEVEVDASLNVHMLWTTLGIRVAHVS